MDLIIGYMDPLGNILVFGPGSPRTLRAWVSHGVLGMFLSRVAPFIRVN